MWKTHLLRVGKSETLRQEAGGGGVEAVVSGLQTPGSMTQGTLQNCNFPVPQFLPMQDEDNNSPMPRGAVVWMK